MVRSFDTFVTDDPRSQGLDWSYGFPKAPGIRPLPPTLPLQTLSGTVWGTEFRVEKVGVP